MVKLFNIIKDITSSGRDAVLASILKSGVRAKALIADGEILWSVGDESFFEGNIDAIEGVEKTKTIKVDGKDVFCEVIKAEPCLVVCGAGHVAIACVKMAKVLGLNVIVIEDREDFAELALEAGADEVKCKPFKEALMELENTGSKYFLCMTRAHAFDQECLEVILPKPFAYVGMLGSPRKINAIKGNLLEKGVEGIDEERFELLHSPVGISIGAKTPAEIAVSVMAQIVEHKNVKNDMDLTFTHEVIDAVMSSTGNCMLCTLVMNTGGTPRTPGTKMVVFDKDKSIGTIGGGAMESEARRRATELLEAGTTESEYIKIGLTETGEITGMDCCGSARVLIERV